MPRVWEKPQRLPGQHHPSYHIDTQADDSSRRPTLVIEQPLRRPTKGMSTTHSTRLVQMSGTTRLSPTVFFY